MDKDDKNSEKKTSKEKSVPKSSNDDKKEEKLRDVTGISSSLTINWKANNKKKD